jgi:hypothetical protein
MYVPLSVGASLSVCEPVDIPHPISLGVSTDGRNRVVFHRGWSKSARDYLTTDGPSPAHYDSDQHVCCHFDNAVEQVQRLLNPLSDPETRLNLERLHGVVAGQGASWLADGPRLPTPRQRQVHLSEENQRELVAAYMAGDAVGNLANVYQLHRGTVSEILTRHGVIGRSHGPRPGANFG